MVKKTFLLIIILFAAIIVSAQAINVVEEHIALLNAQFLRITNVENYDGKSSIKIRRKFRVKVNFAQTDTTHFKYTGRVKYFKTGVRRMKLKAVIQEIKAKKCDGDF